MIAEPTFEDYLSELGLRRGMNRPVHVLHLIGGPLPDYEADASLCGVLIQVEHTLWRVGLPVCKACFWITK